MANRWEKIIGDLPLPDKPGVYLMKDGQGKPLYIGKASSLRKRVRSYFLIAGAHLNVKTAAMLNRVQHLEYIVTDSEVEALILESNLIKEHHPRFNVRLRDDKKYPFIKVTLQEDYPRILMTRQLKNDGARYYGPYTNAKAVRRVLHLLGEIFPLRSCKKFPSGKGRPCLNYDMKRCLAPCAGKVSMENYSDLVRGASSFLEGKREKLTRELGRKMEKASKGLRFEEAALFRDQMEAVGRVMEKQKISSIGGGDEDYIAFNRDGNDGCVDILIVREGKLISEEHFFLKGVKDSPLEEILSSFIEQYYINFPVLPAELLLPTMPQEAHLVRRWMTERKGSRVNLIVPQRGRKKKLLEMAAKNARMRMEELRLSRMVREVATLDKLQKRLQLAVYPRRIEAFDISNTGGRQAVGSMVTFDNGEPDKDGYRRFHIRTVEGMDDYAMMAEVVTRRYQRLLKEGKQLPDLIVIDGGRGHLETARRALVSLGKEEVAVVALAKAEEAIYMPGRKEPLHLGRRDPALQFLQRIRDEAHRFAIQFHRRMRRKALLPSRASEKPWPQR